MTSPSPKGSKKSSPWSQCEKCGSFILHKDHDTHVTDCPPSNIKSSSHFVWRGNLLGLLDTKADEEIKGVSPDDVNNMVFLSQSAMQLCGFTIGEPVMIRDARAKHPPCVRIAWPTEEKSLISVLVTKNGLETSFKTPNIDVYVSKIVNPVCEARQISIVALTSAKNLEILPDLLNRIHKLHIGRLLTEGNNITVMHYGRVLTFEVKFLDAWDTICDIAKDDEVSRRVKTLEGDFGNMNIQDVCRFCKVGEKTKWKVFANEHEYHKELGKKNLLLTIGGLDEEIAEIKDLMNAALGKSATISKSIISRGVLLYGSPGTGKTLIAKALMEQSNVYTVTISLTDLYSKAVDDVDEAITQLFADAIMCSPTIILIDEIDVFCPSKTARMIESDKRLMSHILNLFDTINGKSGSDVFVIATSNKPDSIDPTFRRCGRLDREIEIPVPSPKGRLDTLKKLLLDVPSDVNENELQEIASSAHGFVGSDLVLLCSRAALHASTVRGDTKISMQDLKLSLTRVIPSAMREVHIEIPDVKWSDIGGQDELKLILSQSIEWPLKYAGSFKRMGITPPRGVLMFGPPGCSKTMIAKALATESGLNFLSIKGPELFSKWVGESERAVREVFRKARQVAPAVIFFDEIDAISGERSSGSTTSSVQERVLAQLLTEMDGITPLGDVTVLAATNRPDRIDKALLRPGRLDRIVYVPLPDQRTRKEIFKIKLSKMPTVSVDLERLVGSTECYSGAEVNAVCHEAAMCALEEDLYAATIEMKHFEKALEIITPRTPGSLIKIYEKYSTQ